MAPDALTARAHLARSAARKASNCPGVPARTSTPRSARLVRRSVEPSVRSILPVWMPRVAEIITLIGSHNLLTTPSRAELEDPKLRPLLDEMLHGADGAGADERAQVFRLAWDFVGSALGGRGFLYERFYLTSATRNKQMLHTRFFDRTRSQALLKDMLARSTGSP